MDLLSKSEDLDIFDTKVVSDLIKFSWQNYASHVHFFGAFIHLIYMISFFTYVGLIYQYRDFSARSHLLILMFVCLLYPLIYETL